MKLIRKNKILLALVIVLMLSVFSMIPQMAIADTECTNPGDQSGNGNGVQPILKPGNPTCCQLGYCNFAFKIGSPTPGTSTHTDTDGTLSVTITVTGNLVDWTSLNIPVNAVIVKGGPCANLFEYPGGSMGDTLLHAPVNPSGGYAGISHIDFCYSTGEPECPTCRIAEVVPICAGESVQLNATVTGGVPPLTYLWDDGGAGGTFSDLTAKDPTWTSPSDFTTGIATLTLTVTDKSECPTTKCDVEVTVYEKPDCAITAPDSVCDESTENIAFTRAEYKSYTWVITGGTITSGQGTYKITFDVTPGASSVTIVVKVVDSNSCENTCSVTITVDPLPDCHITGDTEICDGETTMLCASVITGASYSWTGPELFTSTNRCITVGVAGTYEVTIKNECGESSCSVDVTVDPCKRRPCKCSLVVEKRDGDGNIIDDAVFVVDGIEKTTSGGEARWDDLECDTTYEVRELSPIEQTEGIRLGDCGERSTMRVVNKIVVEEEEGEEGELVVAGIMEVLPFTGPAIPYSPFIGISTVLAGTFLYILSKSKKKR